MPRQSSMRVPACRTLLLFLLATALFCHGQSNPQPASTQEGSPTASEQAAEPVATADSPPNDSSEPALTPRQKRNMEKAKAVAQRTLQRLKETMDVETVYREVGVRDIIWRHRIAHASWLGQLSEEMRDGCDDVNLERYALAMADLSWLALAYAVTTQKVEDLDDLEKIRKAIPDDVANVMRQTRFFSALIDQLDMPQITTREELQQMIEESDKVRAALALHVHASSFESKLYKKNVKYIARNGDHADRVATDDQHRYRQDKEVEIYVVWADFLPLVIVNDEGQFRVMDVKE
jgi:hypothetical protein